MDVFEEGNSKVATKIGMVVQHDGPGKGHGHLQSELGQRRKSSTTLPP